MYATWWRGTLLTGLSLALFAGPVGAQDGNVLSLDDALKRSGALEAASPNTVNPRLVGPTQDAAAAQALIEQARVRPSPELSFEAENIAGSGAFSGLSATEYTLSVGQRLEFGGKRGARVRVAEAEALVSSLQGELATAQLGREVRYRYVDAVAAASRLQLARDIVERNRELARIAGALVDAGREPPLRALRAEAALAEAESELQAAQADALSARTALVALWSDDAPPPEVPTNFPEITPPAGLLASDAALRLRIAGADREAAGAAIDRERSLAVPDPVISAGVRRFEESDDHAFLIGVTIPLPFGNRNQGNIDAAEARLRAATAREAVASTDYRLEVEQARSRYLAAEARVSTLSETSLQQAEEALRLVGIGYRNGRFPLIEVLAAAEARDAIREALIKAQEDRGRLAAELIWLAAQ